MLSEHPSSIAGVLCLAAIAHGYNGGHRGNGIAGPIPGSRLR